MSGQIVNRVAESKLVTFDLEAHYPEGKRMALDIKDWLYEGLILREKEFRAFVTAHDWNMYKGAYVSINCSTDAIIPGWAYMLLTAKLAPFALKTVQGSPELLETILYQEIIEKLDVSAYQDKLVIVKGCSKKPVPPNAYIWVSAKLQAVVKSLMYGEACSSVPLFKRK